MPHARIRTDLIAAAIVCLLAAAPAFASITNTPAWTYEPNQVNAHFGSEVAPAGDVNGDGLSDIIVGSGRYSTALSNEGRAWIFFGAASLVPLATTPSWTSSGGAAGAFYGCAVSSAGDVNGDGFADVIVGAYGATNGQSAEGRAFVYHGSATGLSTTPSWTTESNTANANYGYRVCGAGDVNADGYDDVLVSAYAFSSAIALEGKVYLYLGSATGLATTPAWTTQGGVAGMHLGETLSPAGDVNADGYADFLVGAPQYSNGQSGEGAVRLYLGNATATPTLQWQIEGGVVGMRLGRSLAAAGDVDGDCYGDILIGDDTPNAPHAKLYRGSSTGVGTSPFSTWTGTSSNDLGAVVATAGDVNGDGRADVLIGDPLEDFFISDIGVVRVYDGSADIATAVPTQAVFGSVGGAGFGTSARCAGDVNGDGFGDVIVGASESSNGQSLEGRVTLYLGNGPSYAAASEGLHIVEHELPADILSKASAHGDLNGDGIGDVIVTHEETDHTISLRFYAGSQNGFATVPPLGLAAISDTVAYGVVFASSDLELCVVGDVNGDGYEDLIAADAAFDSQSAPENNVGRIKLFFGGPSGFSHAAPWERVNPVPQTQLYGATIQPAGDTNGDGFADFLVGNSTADLGYCELLLGGVEGPSTTPGWSLLGSSAQPLRILGDRACGDFNGDGYSDWAVSVSFLGFEIQRDTRIYEYHGGASLPDSTPFRVLSPPCGVQPCSGSWSNLASADVNGDGYADLIVGDRDWDNTVARSGRVWIHNGSPNGIATAYSWTKTLDPLYRFGNVPTALGDLDADGFDDFAIFMGRRTASEQDAVYIYFGASAGPTSDSAWVIRPPGEVAFVPNGLLKGAVLGADDFDGDGLSDIFIEGQDIPTRDLHDSIFFGNGLPRAGKFRRFRQRRPDDSRAVGYLGRSGGANDVLLTALGRTPAGRGAVRLEAQVRSLGVTWAGSTLTSAYANSGTFRAGSESRVTLSLPVTGLVPNGQYHWRARLRTRSAEFPTTPWFSPTRGDRRETDFRVGVPVAAIDDGGLHAGHFASLHGAPNPFRSSVRLRLRIDEPVRASLVIHDISGRIVHREPARVFAIGEHELVWDGHSDDGVRVAPGVYWARISTPARAISQRLVMVR